MMHVHFDLIDEFLRGEKDAGSTSQASERNDENIECDLQL